MPGLNFEEQLKQYKQLFHPVVPFNSSDKLVLLDFTEKNTALTADILKDTNIFSQHINAKLKAANAKYGIGCYDEHRTIYNRSPLFKDSKKGFSLDEDLEQAGIEPRHLHLGIDIWGKPHTPVTAPLDAIVHSFAFNNAYGDYGGTILLSHNIEGVSFYTLYGHLSLSSITNLQEGVRIKKGDIIGEFGIPQENGSWPPHLHFQIIKDMQGWKKDYPGVCRYSERDMYLANCPDPDIILGMVPYANAQS